MALALKADHFGSRSMVLKRARGNWLALGARFRSDRRNAASGSVFHSAALAHAGMAATSVTPSSLGKV